MEPFQYNGHGDVPYFLLSAWNTPHLTVGFSARSPDHKNHHNYALHVEDCPSRVIDNRKQLAKELGFSFSGWTCGEQVHGTHIERVLVSNRGKGRYSRETAFPYTDGLITQEFDTLLASYYADCVPLFFYAPDLDAIGVAHAGWKGTVQEIGGRMIHRFEQLGASKRKIQVAIGPAISSCCYEVDERVVEPLARALSDEKQWRQVTEQTRKQPPRWRIDLKEANALLLRKAGLTPRQIVISQLCTGCDDAYFYSHRRDQGKTGRMVAFIGKRRERS